MLKYKQFLRLTEGGNIKIYGDEQGNINPTGAKSEKFPKVIHSAQPFNSSDREHLQPDIIDALHAVHNHLNKMVPGSHILGKNAQALRAKPAEPGKEEGPPAFHTGSTRMFYDPKISHKDYADGIKQTGDIDALIDKKHQPAVQKALSATPVGTKFGKYTFHGVIHHGGSESSLVMSHQDHPGVKSQFDLNHVDYKDGEPTQEAKDARRGGSFDDRKMGIKGAHLNQFTHSVAKNAHGMKYANKGLKAGDATPDSVGIINSKEVSKKLFSGSGKEINHADADSFSGMVRLTNEHIPAHLHQAIFDTFKNSLGKDAETTGKPALDHLRANLKGLPGNA